MLRSVDCAIIIKTLELLHTPDVLGKVACKMLPRDPLLLFQDPSWLSRSCLTSQTHPSFPSDQSDVNALDGAGKTW